MQRTFVRKISYVESQELAFEKLSSCSNSVEVSLKADEIL